MAHIEVFKERCIGSGNCTEIASRYFSLDASGTVMLGHSSVAEGDYGQVKLAVEACPVLAVQVHDED